MQFRLRTLLISLVGLCSILGLIAFAVAMLFFRGPSNLGGPIGIVRGQPGDLPKHGFLGVEVESPNAPLIVRSVLAGSGAADAGLHPKDMIISIGSENNPDLTAMKRAAEAASPGDEIPLMISRDSSELQLTVRLMSFMEMAQLQAEAMRNARSSPK